jgi:acetylornithine deacetylase/succinyl-diaminopimelate desuccinylase-like protein
MKKTLAIMTAVIQTVIVASSAYAAEPKCDTSGGDSSLLKCYETEYKRKLHGNDERAKDLVSRAKEQLRDANELANESVSRRQASAYVDLLRKISQTVVTTRKTAAQDCVRMAAKFRSQPTSVVAAVNCRTGHEVELDKQLREFELQLEVLSIEPE